MFLISKKFLYNSVLLIYKLDNENDDFSASQEHLAV